MSDFKLGKKIIPPPVVTPEWTKVPGKPHLERDRQGRLRDTPPEPEPPRPKTPAEEFYEAYGMLGKSAPEILGESND